MPITLTTQLDPAALRRAMAERGIDNRTLIADSGLSPTTLQKALRGDRIGVKAAAAIEHAVNAQILFDRFHIVKHLNEAVDGVRR